MTPTPPEREGAGLARPWCCPEPRCRPLHQLGNVVDLSDPAPGDSFVCFGRAPCEVVFIYDGDEHKNDLRSCWYTPLKGLIANLENADDWALLADAYRAALLAVEGAPR